MGGPAMSNSSCPWRSLRAPWNPPTTPHRSPTIAGRSCAEAVGFRLLSIGLCLPFSPCYIIPELPPTASPMARRASFIHGGGSLLGLHDQLSLSPRASSLQRPSSSVASLLPPSAQPCPDLFPIGARLPVPLLLFRGGRAELPPWTCPSPVASCSSACARCAPRIFEKVCSPPRARRHHAWCRGWAMLLWPPLCLDRVRRG
jgi:hypothetical protein